ncbi:hypothetical protein GC347_13545 [Yersinia pestis]|nr:hypothetical protein [Yersinia pestis]MBE7848350.1 hypothetical protein [Yersinia pestis]
MGGVKLSTNRRNASGVIPKAGSPPATDMTHCSLFIVHCSLFIVHCSLFIVHCSLLIAHCSLLIAHCSLLIAHCSILNMVRPFYLSLTKDCNNNHNFST